jgi:hypothetical protein
MIKGVRFGNTGLEIGIRPLNATSAWPGDDLLLQFGVRDRYTGQAVSISTYVGDENDAQVSTLTASVPEKDYIAVYDKKMLWRANLYIDESVTATFLGTEGVRESVDWNDTHPWDVPYIGAIGAPAWWSAEWGNN